MDIPRFLPLLLWVSASVPYIQRDTLGSSRILPSCVGIVVNTNIWFHSKTHFSFAKFNIAMVPWSMAENYKVHALDGSTWHATGPRFWRRQANLKGLLISAKSATHIFEGHTILFFEQNARAKNNWNLRWNAYHHASQIKSKFCERMHEMFIILINFLFLSAVI